MTTITFNNDNKLEPIDYVSSVLKCKKEDITCADNYNFLANNIYASVNKFSLKFYEKNNMINILNNLNLINKNHKTFIIYEKKIDEYLYEISISTYFKPILPKDIINYKEDILNILNKIHASPIRYLNIFNICINICNIHSLFIYDDTIDDKLILYEYMNFPFVINEDENNIYINFISIIQNTYQTSLYNSVYNCDNYTKGYFILFINFRLSNYLNFKTNYINCFMEKKLNDIQYFNNNTESVNENNVDYLKTMISMLNKYNSIITRLIEYLYMNYSDIFNKFYYKKIYFHYLLIIKLIITLYFHKTTNDIINIDIDSIKYIINNHKTNDEDGIGDFFSISNLKNIFDNINKTENNELLKKIINKYYEKNKSLYVSLLKIYDNISNVIETNLFLIENFNYIPIIKINYKLYHQNKYITECHNEHINLVTAYHKKEQFFKKISKKNMSKYFLFERTFMKTFIKTNISIPTIEDMRNYILYYDLSYVDVLARENIDDYIDILYEDEEIIKPKYHKITSNNIKNIIYDTPIYNFITSNENINYTSNNNNYNLINHTKKIYKNNNKFNLMLTNKKK